MLVDSGITPEIAAARGYRTITTDQVAELGELRPTPFGRTSRHAGLLVPSRDFEGQVVGHQLRPDVDVLGDEGDVKKYVSPYLERSPIDCPPTMRHLVADPSVPVIITEGVKKADAAAARGLLCLALRGVDNWTHDQKTALEQWREIPMQGRRVAIAYDSDFATNEKVAKSAKKLARYLTKARGAVVEFILLPEGENGAKTGLDDWLAANPGGDVWSLAVPRLPEPPARDGLDPDKPQVLATDLHVADAFVEDLDGALRYLADDEAWIAYREGFWNGRAGLTIARSRFQDYIRTIQAYSEQRADGQVVRNDATPWLYNSARIAAVLNHAAANREVHVGSDELDTDPYLFNVGDGTVQLRSGLLLPHSPAHLITMGSPVLFGADADRTEFEKFLREVLPDEETRSFVQRLFGMAMIGEVLHHVFPVFQGTGRNGKGTLLRLVQAAFGSYYSGISKNLLVETKYEEHSTIRTSLYKRRLVTAEEVKEDSVWNAASIKELTGGDDITGRRMRQDEFTFKPSHTLILAANHWPKVSAKDEAFWARVRKVPFNTVFSRPDPDIEKRIRTNELTGILHWMIEGCQDYLRNGLGEPAQIVAATAGIRAESDPLHNFLDDHVEVTRNGDDQLVLGTLYDLYTGWCRSQMPRVTEIPKKVFGADVAKALSIDPPRKYGKANTTTFFGVRLVDGQGVTEGDRNPFGGPTTPSPDEFADRFADEFAMSSPSASSGPAGDAAPSDDSSETEPGTGSANRSEGLGEPIGEQKGDEETAGQPDTANLANLANPFSGVSTESPEDVETLSDQLDSKTAKQRPGASPAHTRADKFAEFAKVNNGEAETEPESHPAYTAVDLATWAMEGAIDLPEGVVVFDIESKGEGLWPLDPDFIRITGVQTGRTIRVLGDSAEAAELLRGARLIIGHNILGFDLLAFALHHGVDLHTMLAEGRVIDTMLTELLDNPPEARTDIGQVLKSLRLDKLGKDKFGEGKADDLADLAKEYGGYDRIPVDDERYVRYCAVDVDITARLAKGQTRTPYAIREHRVAGIAAQMRMSGFRVDVPLLQERLAANEVERKRRVAELVEKYGVPTMKADGKPAAAPLATKEGKEAVRVAYAELGVELGTTKSGSPAFGKEAREEILETYGHREEVAELTDTVGALLGIRSVYGTVDQYRIGDRVHPDITTFQASGRWSITRPGLTVMGKRGGKYVERNIFLPEPGHVIISADLSQVDARVVAAWCQDPAYMELFEPGRDSHTEVALKVWGDASRRDEAKVLGHGWNYGMGIAKLAKKIGSEEVAREFDQSMKDSFPGLVAWKRDVAARADSGELLDNGFGRKLRTTSPRWLEQEQRWTSPGWTQGPALLGQSAARDVMMECLLRMPRELYPYLRAVVHDEIVMSIPADQADEIEAKVMAAMNFTWAPQDDFTPIRIEAGLAKRGTAWGECYAK